MQVLLLALILGSLDSAHQALSDPLAPPAIRVPLRADTDVNLLGQECSNQARWLSLFDAHVRPSEEQIEGGSTGTDQHTSVDAAGKHILIVGGMQNLEDYQGDIPIPVSSTSRRSAFFMSPHWSIAARACYII